jgi:hypothetical protein
MVLVLSTFIKVDDDDKGEVIGILKFANNVKYQSVVLILNGKSLFSFLIYADRSRRCIEVANGTEMKKKTK